MWSLGKQIVSIFKISFRRAKEMNWKEKEIIVTFVVYTFYTCGPREAVTQVMGGSASPRCLATTVSGVSCGRRSESTRDPDSSGLAVTSHGAADQAP